jgi:hypothetical protein
VSVIDELRRLEERVAKRMQELRPLVDEYHKLEQYAPRLGVSRGGGADTSAPAPRSTPRSRSRRNSAATPRTAGAATTAGAAKASGSGRGRREQLLSMVKARPGITVREVGTELGVDPTSLYRIVHRLEKEGELRKRGRELLPS